MYEICKETIKKLQSFGFRVNHRCLRSNTEDLITNKKTEWEIGWNKITDFVTKNPFEWTYTLYLSVLPGYK